MVYSFLAFLLFFGLIGLSSVLKSKGTKKDYYIASSSVRPSLVGLSAVSTNNSGYMFIGMIGYTFVNGLSSLWVMIGWIGGDFLSSLYIHRKLRNTVSTTGEVSFAGTLSNWWGDKNRLLQKTIGLITLVFLLAYAGAQLVAGSKALEVLFGWPLWAGAVMGAGLVLAYCIAGGIRASIWTDAAQSIVMIVAMTMLLFVALRDAGGVSGAIHHLGEVEGFLSLFPDDLIIPGLAGGFLFAVSWAFAGLSVIGQPHIMIRFMALNTNEHMRSAKWWYYVWFTFFYLAAIGVGMLSRIYFTEGAFDEELALPMMAQELLHPGLAGVILAGVFAATMSTADSVILSCSSAFTHDVLGSKIRSTAGIKIATGCITLGALGWALVNQQSVFNLVIMAWSGLASAFAPLLIVLTLGMKPPQHVSILAVITGFITALLWRYFSLHLFVYEGMPGILVGLGIFLAYRIHRGRSLKEMTA
ncbi:sodium/proline symporter [Chitinivibrio alkaliphilus]|uniref:Sodium/proline symporter n=1 Tax=Chitinivibrio alkaliphilus ACht1 TaxID=1313304 RepID=U7D924_9BACT|nr:sodium/proline symporter [Chitinivibrio alkaliphilus]ERP30895.1 Na(+)/proline cotransporter PutP [Chitinivibrio alkaliphilus ACht1]